jgi:hypothetical protein
MPFEHLGAASNCLTGLLCAGVAAMGWRIRYLALYSAAVVWWLVAGPHSVFSQTDELVIDESAPKEWDQSEVKKLYPKLLCDGESVVVRQLISPAYRILTRFFTIFW